MEKTGGGTEGLSGWRAESAGGKTNCPWAWLQRGEDRRRVAWEPLAREKGVESCSVYWVGNRPSEKQTLLFLLAKVEPGFLGGGSSIGNHPGVCSAKRDSFFKLPGLASAVREEKESG